MLHIRPWRGCKPIQGKRLGVLRDVVDDVGYDDDDDVLDDHADRHFSDAIMILVQIIFCILRLYLF